MADHAFALGDQANFHMRWTGLPSLFTQRASVLASTPSRAASVSSRTRSRSSGWMKSRKFRPRSSSGENPQSL